MSDATEPYVCTLDAASKERAKKELNEDEKNREGAVATLREWVLQQQWMTSPTDSSFLLRFLRTKKFSQLEARKTLENFWKKRTENAKWYSNKNAQDPKALELLKTGFLLRFPNVDREGRVCLMDRTGHLDMDEVISYYGVDTVFKTYSMVLDWVMMDERVQVNGTAWVVDMGGSTIKHQTHLYNLSNTKKFMDLVQGVYPIRTKVVHIYNTSPVLEIILSTARSFVGEKMRSRYKTHGKSLVNLYEQMDMSVLPKEYLPDDYKGPNSGTISEITDYMIQEMTSDHVTSYIHGLSNGAYGVKMKLKPDDLPAESFRKLNID